MVDWVKLFADKDIEGIKKEIMGLKSNLTEKQDGLQDFISIRDAIIKQPDTECIYAVFSSLTDHQIKHLVERLLETGNLPEVFIEILSKYLIATKELQRDVRTALITKLLLSLFPLESNYLNRLLTQLSPHKIADILLQLYNQSNTLHVAIRKKSKNYTSEINVFYRKKLDGLLTAICIHMGNGSFNIEELSHRHSILANFIMAYRLKLTESKTQKHEMVSIILQKAELFNWQENDFIKEFEKTFLTVLKNVEVTEAKKLYFKYHGLNFTHGPTRSDKAKFLERTYNDQYNKDLFKDLLRAHDDDFLIYTLSTVEIRDFYFNNILLKRLPLEKLHSFLGHIYTISYLSNDRNKNNLLLDNYLKIVCGIGVNNKETRARLRGLAKELLTLNTPHVEKVVERVLNNLNSDYKLQKYWLASIYHYCPKHRNELIPFIENFIIEHKKKTHRILSLFNQIDSHTLVNIFSKLVQNKRESDSFNCFIDFFKGNKPQTETKLMHLLNSVPTIQQNLLQQLIGSIDDKNLFTLIERLKQKSLKKPEFSNTLEQILLLFCHRLSDPDRNQGPIASWSTEHFYDWLAEKLLKNAESFYELSKSNLTIKGVIGLNPVAYSLKFKICRVLNSIKVSLEDMSYIALNLLVSFKDKPHRIQMIFENLQKAQGNFNYQGKYNFKTLKESCWKVFFPKEKYNEKLFVNHIASLKESHDFDPALIAIAANDGFSMDLPQRAKMLAKAKQAISNDIPDGVLIKLLIHSVHEESIINWQKAKDYFNASTYSKALSFCDQLIQNVIGEKLNPLLTEKAYQFVTENKHFNKIFIHLAIKNMRWVVSQSKDSFLQKNLSLWVEDILVHRDNASGQVANILKSLHHNNQLIQLVISHKGIKNPNSLAQLYAAICDEDERVELLEDIVELVKNQPLKFRKEFIINMNEYIEVNEQHLHLLSHMNELITCSRNGFNVLFGHDNEMVLGQLNRLKNIIDTAKSPKIKKKAWDMVEQFIESFSNHQDIPWVTGIVSSKAYEYLFKQWASSNDVKKSVQNKSLPNIALILIKNYTAKLPKSLLNSPEVQSYFYEELSCPNNISIEANYIELYVVLKDALKIKLFRELCNKDIRFPIQNRVLPYLAIRVDVQKLFRLFEENPVFVMVEAIYYQHNAEKELSKKQRFKLLGTIKSDHQLLKILNNDNDEKTHAVFINDVFSFCEYDAKKLQEFLYSCGISNKTLAIIANVCSTKMQKHLMQKLIEIDPNISDSLIEFISYPDDGFEPNRDSFLYELSMKVIQNPNKGKPVHQSFLLKMPSKQKFEGLKKQFYASREWVDFSEFLFVLKDLKQAAEKGLLSARWHFNLAFLNQGILSVISFYKKAEPKIKVKIEQTSLYEIVILPILLGNKEWHFSQVSLKLPQLLKEYIHSMRSIDKTHVSRVGRVFQLYENRIELIKNYSNGTIQTCFCIDKQSNLEQANWLVKAYDNLFVNPSKKTNRINQQLRMLLYASFNDKEISNIKANNSWIFTNLLISPLSKDLKKEQLVAYIQSMNFTPALQHIENFYRNFQNINQALMILSSRGIDKCNSIEEALNQIKSFSIRDINNFIHIAEAMGMPVLRGIFSLTKHIKKLRLTEVQIRCLTLPALQDNGLSLEWLKHELMNIDDKTQFLRKRHEQLLTGLYSYYPESFSNKRLVDMEKHCLSNISEQAISDCFASYIPILNSYSPVSKRVLLWINKNLVGSMNASSIISKFSHPLIDRLWTLAMRDTVTHQQLLQQLIQVKSSEVCYKDISLQIKKLLQVNGDIELSNPMRLLDKYVSKLSSDNWQHLLALVRLLLIIKPSVDGEILLSQNFLNNKPLKKQSFVVDAVLFENLLKINNLYLDDNSTETGAHWLKQQSSPMIFQYHRLMDNLILTNPSGFPLAYYYWISWRSARIGKYSELLEGGLTWLESMNIYQDKQEKAFVKLVQLIADQDMLNDLIDESQRKNLEDKTVIYLCKAIAQIHPFKEKYYPLIIKLSAIACMENLMFKQRDNQYKLMQIQLENPESLKLLEDTSNINKLLEKLRKVSFPLNEIKGLFDGCKNPTAKSLLALHLLTRKDYSDMLGAKNYLESLQKGKFIDSPYQSILAHIKNKHLTKLAINSLTPAGAMSLFFSIKHFSSFNEDKLKLLLTQYEFSREMMSPWLRERADEPNAKHLLPILMEYSKKIFFDFVEQLPELQDGIIDSLMLMSQKPNSLSDPRFLKLCKEKHLSSALQYYLHQPNRKVLRDFVTQLINDYLKAKKTPLSRNTVKWMLSIYNHKDFKDLSKNIAHSLNQFVRLSAQTSDSNIFYDNKRLNLARANQVIHNEPDRNNLACFNRVLTGVRRLRNMAGEHGPKGENSLMKKMRKNDHSLKLIDYFLMHYRGDSSKLYRLLHDYFSLHEYQGMSVNLYSTCQLMFEAKVPKMVSDIIFNTLKEHVSLHDETVSKYLLRYRPKAIISYYGKRNDFDNLISFCNKSLNHLNPEAFPDQANIATKALKHARLEKELSEMKGIFKSVRKWFRRIRTYGFTGFFKPKKPVWHKENTGIEPVVRDYPVNRAGFCDPSLTYEQALEEALKSGVSEHIYQALWTYNHSNAPSSNAPSSKEFSLRMQVEDLYQSLLRSDPNHNRHDWLKKHEGAFIFNRERLVEISLREDNRLETQELLKSFGRDSVSFEAVSKSIKPGKLDIEFEKKNTSVNISGGLLGRFSNFISSLSNQNEKPSPQEETKGLENSMH